jgi:putative cell wall-binding protein
MHKATGSTRGRLALVGVVTAGAVLVSTGAAWAAKPASGTRYGGSDRYDTARLIASAAFPAGQTQVILASGLSYPDALSAAYLAGRGAAPILVTDPANLSTATLQAIQAMKASGVDVVGGTAAVSDHVARQLTGDGYVVSRTGGADRYATNNLIDTMFPPNFVGSIAGKGPTALVASGLDFADALSASPIAFAVSTPIVLTDPNSLPSSSQNTLTSLGIKNAIVLGGTAAISNNVVLQLQADGITVTRVGGADRTETATLLASQIEQAGLGWTAATTTVATGANFADALTGSVLAGVHSAPLLLTENSTDAGSYTTNWLNQNSSTINQIDVFGGPAAISDQLYQALLADG